MSEQIDDELLALFSCPTAHVDVFCRDVERVREICLFGNRAGILTLTNVLLWLYDSEREYLSVTTLPFCQMIDSVRLLIQLVGDSGTPPHESWQSGVLIEDAANQFRWRLTEDNIISVALGLHRLVCRKASVYWYFECDPELRARIHARVVG